MNQNRKNLIQTMCAMSVCIVLLAGGCKKPTSENKATEQAESTDMEEMINSGQYSVAEAKKTIYAFLTHPQLKNLATNYAIGGTLPKSLFIVHSLDSGVVMWYSFDKRNKKVYLSVEKIKTTDYPTQEPKKSEQIFPTALSMYSGQGVDSLLNQDNSIDRTVHDPVLNLPGCRKLQKNQTRVHIKDFKDLIDIIDPNNKHKSEFAYFENNPRDSTGTIGLLQELCDQKGTEYIRYYFGYDASSEPATIRVVLFSVDKDGNNILHLNEEKKSDALVVQRSIPPAR